jgi:hypothetical protein
VDVPFSKVYAVRQPELGAGLPALHLPSRRSCFFFGSEADERASKLNLLEHFAGERRPIALSVKGVEIAAQLHMLLRLHVKGAEGCGRFTHRGPSLQR